ncbi:MAG: glycosyltransferase family 39 protein [Anaerolineae bacterium]|nr:glycosyltransferase family 39 protein [Anaerolineae bacterium]
MNDAPGAIARRRAPPAAVLAIILLLALGLRLYGISAEALWLDEATSLMLARMDVPTLIEWTALDIHPPLYYILLHYWIALGESELVVRGLSTLAALLSVGVIFALGRLLFSRRVGLIAACLLAWSPFHIWYSQEARMYAWVTLWISASLFLALRLLKTDATPRRTWLTWVGYVLATAAALYTHYYAVFGVLLANLYFLYFLVRGRVARRLLWQWVASQAAVFVLFLPWLPTFLLPITVGGGGWIALGAGKPSLAVLPQTAVLYMVGPARAFYPSLLRRVGYLLYGGLFGIALVTPFFTARRQSKPLAVNVGREDASALSAWESLGFCLAYLVIPLGMAWVASQLFKPMYSARYMLPFLIPLLLIVARGVEGLPLRWFRWVTLLVLLSIMGYGVMAQIRMQDKPDWREVAAYVEAHAQPQDGVLFLPGWHAKPYGYYAQDRLTLYDDIPVPVSQYPTEVPAYLDELIERHARIWFVWEQGHYTDPQGEVYAYLQGRCSQVEDRAVPLLGRVILFARRGSESRSATTSEES